MANEQQYQMKIEQMDPGSMDVKIKGPGATPIDFIIGFGPILLLVFAYIVVMRKSRRGQDKNMSQAEGWHRESIQESRKIQELLSRILEKLESR